MVPNKTIVKICKKVVENGFQGLEGQQIPEMTDEYIICI
jgi:hypothetical protein